MNKITIGTIAVILSFLLVIQISPVTVIGENESEPSSNESPASLYTAPVHDTEESASIEIIRELENGREENVKRFEMSNGTVMAAQYESPVYYLDNGQWMDIDNTLSDTPGGEQDDEDGYQSTKNTIQVKFAKKHDAKKLVKMNLGDYQLSWSFVGAEKSKNTKYTVKNPEKTNDGSDITVLKNITSGVIYEDILEHVDLEYYIRSTTVKENIIIKNKLDSYCFQMILRPKKLTPVLRENAVFFENENGESVFQIPAPFMFDAAGAESSNVKLELTPDSKEKEYVLTVTADPEWINDENRIFPVTIDPVISKESTHTGIYASGSYAIYPKHSTSKRLHSSVPSSGNSYPDLILYSSNGGKQQEFILEAADDTNSLYMESTAAYSTSGVYPKSMTTLDGTTTTTYDENNDRLMSSANAYTRTDYSYTNGKQDYSVTQYDRLDDRQLGRVDYQYTGEQLTKIISPGATCHFEYDAYGNRTSTKVGSQTLMTNTYQQYNGELFRSTYGNGHYVNYFYDNLHRLQGISKISGGSTQISAWEYNSFGNVSKLVDGSAGLTTYFNYDSIGRISSFARSDSFAGTVTYDTKNRVSSAQYRTSVGSRSTQYTYDNATGLVTAAHTDGISWSNAYDGLNRRATRYYDFGENTEKIFESFSYRRQGNRTDGQVTSHTFDDHMTLYAYDAAGNITKITLPDGTVREYTYDAAGRLLSEKDQLAGRINLYTYNASGNLSKRDVYLYSKPTGSSEWVKGTRLRGETWSYSNTGWGDQCTSFSGMDDYHMTYDEIGNPLTYGEGWTCTWQNGRQLKTLKKGTSQWAFTYDINGQRVSKVESKTGTDGTSTMQHTTKYYYDGSKLTAELKDGTIVWYNYDESGAPIGMRVNGRDYLFRKNLQGGRNGDL